MGGFNKGGSSTVLTDLQVDGTTVTVDASNNRLGLGTASPGTQVQVEGSAPYITLKNDTAENTDGGCESRIIFEDHANVTLAQIQGSHDGSSDDTKGDLIFSTHDGSSLDEALRIDSAQLATFAAAATVTTDLTVGGDIVLDDGGSLKEAGGVAAFTFDASGNVTKIGQDTHTSGHFLKFDGSKFVLDASSGGEADSIAADNINGGDAEVNITTTTGGITLKTQQANQDIILSGSDAGVGVEALKLDMSEGGSALFSNDVKLISDAAILSFGAGADVTFTHDNGTGMDITSAGNLDIDCTAGSVTLGASLADGQTLKLGKNGAVETIIAPHGTAGSEAYSVTNTSGNTDGAYGQGAILFDAAAGGIGIKWADDKDLWAEGGQVVLTANHDTAAAIKLHADAGSSQTIQIINDEGTETGAEAEGAILIESKVGGIGLHGADDKRIWAEAGEVIVTANNNGAAAIKLHADAGTSQTIQLLNDAGTATNAIDIVASAGGIDIDAAGAVAIDSSAGTISVAANNVDQNVNLATGGTRTLNIGILDGTDTTTWATRGNISHSGSITVGQDDEGYDVKFYGESAGQYMLWDESADELVLAGDTKLSFHDAAGGENIIASSDGHLEINAGTTLDVTAPTVDLNGKVQIDSLNNHPALLVNCDVNTASNNTTSGLSIDFDKTAATTSDNTMYGMFIDMDNTTATNGTNTMVGINVAPTLTHAADAGLPTVKGITVTATGGTNGTAIATGMELTSTGADVNNGLIINCADGGNDLIIQSSADTGDYFQIATTANGATTISTTDDDGAAADIIFAPDGVLRVNDDTKLTFGDGEDASFEYDEDDTDTLLYAGANMRISDDVKLEFGSGGDASFEYDEDGTDRLLYAGAGLRISDDVKLEFGTGGDATIEYDEDGNDVLLINGAATKFTVAGVEIENGSSAGAAALLIDNDDTDQIALNITAANIDADVIDVTADAVTTANVVDITADAITSGAALKIVSDCSSTTARSLVHVHQDHASATHATGLRIIQDGAGPALDAGGAIVDKRPLTQDTDTAGATITTAQFIDGIFVAVNRNNSETDTTPTAAQIVAAIPNCTVGATFRFMHINNGSNTITLTGGTGVENAATQAVTGGQVFTLTSGTGRSYVLRVGNIGGGSESVTILPVGDKFDVLS